MKRKESVHIGLHIQTWEKTTEKETIQQELVCKTDNNKNDHYETMFCLFQQSFPQHSISVQHLHINLHIFIFPPLKGVSISLKFFM